MNNTLTEVMLNANLGVETSLRSERRTLVVIALVFLPWTAVVLFTAGAWATLNFLAYAIVVFATGYCIITVALPAPARSQTIMLAPAAGILVISALTAFWVRLGLPVIWAPAFWLALTAAGMLGLWRDRAGWAKSTIAYGLTLALFSVVICAVYFVPSACNDLVSRRDGSFNWKYIDTQHFHAMAASIKSGGSPPKAPGTATAELFYHFAPYAPAAAISRLDGLDLGDAVARVTRGASLWALVLSCFGFGTLLSLRATGAKFGGLISVAGLFFYGSLLSLFTAAATTSGHVTRAILFNISGVDVLADGGPFDHLLGGGSVQQGLVAITAIMGLILVERERESPLTWRGFVLLALPALAVPTNSVAALYCVGAAGILLFWGRLGDVRSWLSIMLMSCLFLGAWTIMGYGQGTDAGHVMLNHQAGWQWWSLAVWFIVGLGFRIVGFSWISRPWKDPVSAMVLASVLGLLTFSLPLQIRDENERYGIYFLQSIFSIFAFSRLTSRCLHRVERSQIITEWLTLSGKGMLLFVAWASVNGVVAFAIRGDLQIGRLRIILAFVLLAFLIGISASMKRSSRFSMVASAVLMGVLMIGFLAWTTVWVRYGIGMVKTGITYPPGEVRGLRRLGELMAPGERFATNKHALGPESLAPPRERSYGYSALSERPVLLEGYLARGESFLPWFGTLLRDNDLLFTTTDPDTLRDVARKWRVRFLVARPGTDIALPRPLPSWMVEQQDCGDLKIYRVD
jgi:hypothetical protein